MRLRATIRRYGRRSTARSLRCWPKTRADRTTTSARRSRCQRAGGQAPRRPAARVAARCAASPPSSTTRRSATATEALVELFYAPGTLLDEVAESLRAHPEVVEAWSVTGEADAIARVRTRDNADLERLIMELQRDGHVVRTRSQVVMSRAGRPAAAVVALLRCASPWPRSPTSTTPIRRSDRARRVRVSVDPEKGVEVVLPRRAPEQAAARGGASSCGRGSSGACARSSAARAAVAARGGTVPYLGDDAALVPRARPHARAPPRRRAARPRRRPARGARALVPPAWRSDEIAPRLDEAVARARHALHGADDPQPEDALGQLLVDRRDELQLAAAARARGGPRLRRLARGLPPAGHGPLAAVLGARRPPHARLPATPRRWLRRHGGTLVL